MINAKVFKQIFGIYATELWAMSESDFLEWLNAKHIATESRPKDAWTPCSERLPDLDDYYLVTAMGAMNPDFVSVAQCLKTIDFDNKLVKRWEDETGDPMEVVAWMKLPEAYRGDDNG